MDCAVASATLQLVSLNRGILILYFSKLPKSSRLNLVRSLCRPDHMVRAMLHLRQERRAIGRELPDVCSVPVRANPESLVQNPSAWKDP